MHTLRQWYDNQTKTTTTLTSYVYTNTRSLSFVFYTSWKVCILKYSGPGVFYSQDARWRPTSNTEGKPSREQHTIELLSVLVPDHWSLWDGVRVALEHDVFTDSCIHVVWTIRLIRLLERRHRCTYTHTCTHTYTHTILMIFHANVA